VRCGTSNILVNYREHKYATVVLDLNIEGGAGGREYNAMTGKEK
jgi:hypothetical protein